MSGNVPARGLGQGVVDAMGYGDPNRNDNQLGNLCIDAGQRRCVRARMCLKTIPEQQSVQEIQPVVPMSMLHLASQLASGCWSRNAHPQYGSTWSGSSVGGV